MAGRDDGDWLEFVAELMREALTELPLEQIALMLEATFDSTGIVVDEVPSDGAVQGVPETPLAARIRRLLAGLDRQARAYASALAASPAEGRAVATSVELTPRERGVLGLLAEGHTAGAIARRLGIAERTVHKHLERCYSKLGVADRLSAVLQAQRLGLVAA